MSVICMIPTYIAILYSKTCVKRPLSKRPKNGFLNWEREHSAILSTFVKLPVFIKTFVLSIFERLFYTGLTVPICLIYMLGYNHSVCCLG